MYEIKTQFRLVIGLEAENVLFKTTKLTHGNDFSTSQISVGCIDLFDDNMENIIDMYRISIKSIDDTYHIGSVKWYRARMYSQFYTRMLIGTVL